MLELLLYVFLLISAGVIMALAVPVATTAIEKHIGEAIKANNSHETIKKILSDDKAENNNKLEDVKTIVEAKKNNLFLKLFNQDKASESIADLYLSAFDKYHDRKTLSDDQIIKKLEFFNYIDDLKRKDPHFSLNPFKISDSNKPYCQFNEMVEKKWRDFFNQNVSEKYPNLQSIKDAYLKFVDPASTSADDNAPPLRRLMGVSPPAGRGLE